MYTIKQASLRSGVSVPLIRAWERRYGVVLPGRTAARYRLYDDAAMERLRTMRRLVDDGWSPSAAAAAILAGNAGRPTEERSQAGPADAGPVDAGPADAGPVNRFVDSAARMDQTGIEEALDEMFARGSFERVAQQSLLPALRALGQGWEAGTIGVAAEHEASNAVYRRLAAAYEAAGNAQPGRPILVGLPPGGRHELGALAFAVTARRAGLNVAYLGADVPSRDWVRAVVDSGARAVVLGVVIASDVAPALEVARAIASDAPGAVVAFGGRAAPAPADGDAASWLRLPDDLAPAVEALRGAL